MNQAQAAFDPNRLPWLADERRPVRILPPIRRPGRGIGSVLLPWSLVALLLLAGISYWLGMRSMHGEATDAFADETAAATVALPEPSEPVPMPSAAEEPRLVAPVEAEPTEVEPMPTPAPAPRIETSRTRPKVAAKPKPATEPETSDAAEAAPKKVEYWPAAEVEGADGRLARIGTFSSSSQAKRGWWRLMRAYPGMRKLKAVVVPVESQRDFKTYYRLQFGTTSQAHSAVLCQRMRMIGQSCVVVGVDRAIKGTDA